MNREGNRGALWRRVHNQSSSMSNSQKFPRDPLRVQFILHGSTLHGNGSHDATPYTLPNHVSIRSRTELPRALRHRSRREAQQCRYKLCAEYIPAVISNASLLADLPIPKIVLAATFERLVSNLRKSLSYNPEPFVGSPYLVRLTNKALFVILNTLVSRPQLLWAILRKTP